MEFDTITLKDRKYELLVYKIITNFYSLKKIGPTWSEILSQTKLDNKQLQRALGNLIQNDFIEEKMKEDRNEYLPILTNAPYCRYDKDKLKHIFEKYDKVSLRSDDTYSFGFSDEDFDIKLNKLIMEIDAKSKEFIFLIYKNRERRFDKIFNEEIKKIEDKYLAEFINTIKKQIFYILSETIIEFKNIENSGSKKYLLAELISSMTINTNEFDTLLSFNKRDFEIFLGFLLGLHKRFNENSVLIATYIPHLKKISMDERKAERLLDKFLDIDDEIFK